MSTVELTRFRVLPERTEELLAARADMLEDFEADRAGFLGARLVQLPDNQWLDIVDWATPEDFAASREKGANLPGIARFFAAIDSLVAAEEGVSAA
ncbi:antibiotic biosynthesis monooxygenase [Kribbella sp. NPDC003557]|uniref:antibiotic biosynthesis monooxygenase n=1 Tax=Kribbella sp. NPDC003557 TaxID=3154449 RepID=UPI0033A14A23